MLPFKTALAATAILTAALAASPAARADYPSDVESARMNARSGGPTNAHDAELLKRWGTTSGTRRHAHRSHHHIKHTARERDR